MFNILDKASEYSNGWNYTFLVVALIAIFIGAIMTAIKVLKRRSRIEAESKKLLHNEKVLDDPESLLKRK